MCQQESQIGEANDGSCAEVALVLEVRLPRVVLRASGPKEAAPLSSLAPMLHNLYENFGALIAGARLRSAAKGMQGA